jgi:hypothetical protein
MYRSGAENPGRIVVRYRPYARSDIISFLIVGSASPLLAAMLWGRSYRAGALVAALLCVAVIAAAVRETRAIVVEVDHERCVVLLAPGVGRHLEIGLEQVKAAELEVSLRRTGPRTERSNPMEVARIVLLMNDGTRIAVNDRPRPGRSAHEAALEQLRTALEPSVRSTHHAGTVPEHE